jgi:hypothetical protein
MRKENYFGDLNTEASLWVLISKAAASIAFSFVMVLIVFWLEFGEIPGLAYGFGVFLVVLQILMIIGLRFADRPGIDMENHVKYRWIDLIGAWWLVACAFGAFIGWVAGYLAQAYPRHKEVFHIARIVFTIVIPVVTMLPNFRYIRKNAAFIQIPIIIIVTLLPVLLGIPTAILLWHELVR